MGAYSPHPGVMDELLDALQRELITRNSDDVCEFEFHDLHLLNNPLVVRPGVKDETGVWEKLWGPTVAQTTNLDRWSMAGTAAAMPASAINIRDAVCTVHLVPP